MRSALLNVKGVTRARVTLEGGEATVICDPRQATDDDLIAAVNNAQGPSRYSATIKVSPR